ncbi:LuxR C-terminal-related transcriptional regulator [Glaciimonas sp. PCH181]|uniref:LuxR C-terminal-related transcriptional regulator n=1 Tax=Glaciimonas sp. PCH181 TaxID=2133943 RepID=UPI000D3C97DA|nr:LuxR C-terminal-related transcriptional regulator [Glaciimonas sp. PCH181]PUA20485.1 hypothetical protein C7W93_12260 [Glaciimonas sp. PCH181]
MKKATPVDDTVPQQIDVTASAKNSVKKSTLRRSPPSKYSPPLNTLHLVTRQQVIARMLDADGAKLMMITAPAGFGKTTLLRSLHDLLIADGKAVAWLTLDSGENDLDQLIQNLAQALQKMCAGDGFSDAIQIDTAAHPHDQLRSGLMDTIIATALPFVLILDEFENLHSPAVLSLIQQAIETLGVGQQIIIGSREKPLLNLARLRARQQLLECDATHLRFSLQETTEFLRDKRQLALTDQEYRKLHEVTDGWAAALWLSSLALENNPDPRQFVKTFSGLNSTIASYLAEDVLSRKPQYLQEFILQTSILHQFCVESCNAVTGRQDSQQLLDECERSNMFITPLDDQRHWFSYHPLFATFLRAQLEQRYPGLSQSLHRRAANWYLEQDRPIRAIDHAVAAGDDVLVLALLEKKAESLLLQGRVRLLARWFDSLKRTSLESKPKLIFVYAWVLIHTNRSAEALALVEAIDNKNKGSIHDSADASVLDPDVFLSYPASMALRTFSLVMLDRIEETAPIWEGAHLLENAEYGPFLHTMLLIGCAYYYATIGRYQEARQALDRVPRQCANTRSLFGDAVAGYMNSMLDMLQGKFRSAAARLHMLIGEQPTQGIARHAADSGFSSIYLAEIYYETGALDKAKRLLKMYLPLVKEAGVPDHVISSHVIYARILRAEGNSNDALQALFDMEHLGLQRGLSRIVNMARIERARGALLDGDLVAAKELLALIPTAIPSDHRDFQPIANDIDSPTLALMRLKIQCNQAAVALPLLKEHLQDAYRRGRMRYALRTKVVYALALTHAGQRNLALRTIAEALQEALSETFTRIFLDEGPELIGLIEEFLDDSQRLSKNALPQALDGGSGSPHISAELILFARKICDAYKETHKIVPKHFPSPPPEQTSRPRNAGNNEVTDRERDVLQLLAQGYGNQIIAEKLFVSVTTVRAHLRNINLKLEVHNRTEAIAIARKRAIIR